MTLIKHVSFIDCPGHEVLMSKMLNASASMDAAIIVMAANADCPQPQTAEHLAAAETVGIKRIIPVQVFTVALLLSSVFLPFPFLVSIKQNKLDLVSLAQARASCKEIQAFIQGTAAEKSPIIPLSAQV